MDRLDSGNDDKKSYYDQRKLDSETFGDSARRGNNRGHSRGRYESHSQNNQKRYNSGSNTNNNTNNYNNNNNYRNNNYRNFRVCFRFIFTIYFFIYFLCRETKINPDQIIKIKRKTLPKSKLYYSLIKTNLNNKI